MSWYIGFYAAVAAVLVAAGVSVYLLVGKYKKGRQLNVIHVMVVACFVTVVALCIPPYMAVYASEPVGAVKIIVLSFQKAIRVFGADEIYDIVFDTIDLAPAAIADGYMTMVMATQFVAPLLTFGFMLSFFKNISAYLRYVRGYFRDAYVFSQLNEKSAALAKDIRNVYPRAQIVFADVFENQDDTLYELLDSAKEIGAICFKKDITSVNFGLRGKYSQIYFFAMGDDETQNVDHAIKLIGTYNAREGTHLYIFSTGVESELILAGKEKGRMKVRRVNEIRSLIYRTLYEDGGKIFENARGPEGDKQISAVIVGMGGYGTEMAKALTWYCQMDGYHVKINAFDRDPLAGEKFAALCPELMSNRYNGVCVPGEAEYSIAVHSGFDVATKKFSDGILGIKDASYVLVCLGSDEMNLRTAVNLRMLFERNGAKPVIQAILTSSEAKEAMSDVKNSGGQPYNIDFIGDVESSYSEKVILDSDAEEDAFARHKAYCYGDADKEEDFWRYEYCYRSSLASTVHADARIKCGIAGADKKEEELTERERDSLENLEHRRWNAYMRAEGFVYSGSPERSSRNDLGKMHHNLVDFSKLSDEDKRKDSRVASKT